MTRSETRDTPIRQNPQRQTRCTPQLRVRGRAWEGVPAESGRVVQRGHSWWHRVRVGSGDGPLRSSRKGDASVRRPATGNTLQDVAGRRRCARWEAREGLALQICPACKPRDQSTHGNFCKVTPIM
eukprot:213604-Chlamydomonas_euryale.AAC.35